MVGQTAAAFCAEDRARLENGARAGASPVVLPHMGARASGEERTACRPVEFSRRGEARAKHGTTRLVSPTTPDTAPCSRQS